MAEAVKNPTVVGAKKKAAPKKKKKPSNVTMQLLHAIKFKVWQIDRYSSSGYAYNGTAVRKGDSVELNVECQKLTIPLKTLQDLRDILSQEMKVDTGGVKSSNGVSIEVTPQISFTYRGPNGGTQKADVEKKNTQIHFKLQGGRGYNARMPLADLKKLVELAEVKAKVIIEDKK